MKKMLTIFLSLFFFFFAACSPPDGRLMPVNLPSEQLTDTLYKNDTAILKSPYLKFHIVGEWSEKSGYAFEITIENLSDKQRIFDAGKIILTGDRLEKAVMYLRRNNVEDPYSDGGDTEKNLIAVKPSEKKKIYLQFTQEMKKEEYYAAGRKGDKLKIAVNTSDADLIAEFEAVSGSQMKPVS